VTHGDEAIIEQITKQLNKLVDVVKLMDVTEGAHIEREMLLVKVKAATGAARDEITRLTAAFRGQIVDITRSSCVVEVTGKSDKLGAFIAALEPASIIELVRSGPSAISRGAKALRS
jgi:acetolactate synthase-1/3 small subunit